MEPRASARGILPRVKINEYATWRNNRRPTRALFYSRLINAQKDTQKKNAGDVVYTYELAQQRLCDKELQIEHGVLLSQQRPAFSDLTVIAFSRGQRETRFQKWASISNTE